MATKPNTMLMATYERRREFAVMLALGATPRAVRAVVLHEAVALGVLSLALGSVMTFPLMVWFHTAPPDMSWAIGDLTGEPMLAHKASAQGEMVAEIIAGARRRFMPVAIPAVCFTEPEIVSVGLSPDKVLEGVDVVVGQFPFQANGRALSMDAGNDGGFVRVIARKADHRILGIQGVGRYISELAGEFTMLVEMGAVLEDVAGIIHAHPTLGEATHEASLKALGHAIHV